MSEELSAEAKAFLFDVRKIDAKLADTTESALRAGYPLMTVKAICDLGLRRAGIAP